MSLSTKALILRKTAPAKGASVYHDVVLEQRPVPALKHGELLLRVSAVAFNRRDVSRISALCGAVGAHDVGYCSYGCGLGCTRALDLGPSWARTPQVCTSILYLFVLNLNRVVARRNGRRRRR